MLVAAEGEKGDGNGIEASTGVTIMTKARWGTTSAGGVGDGNGREMIEVEEGMSGDDSKVGEETGNGDKR
ncbi:hypothetical protein BHM03_00051349 [Ensete ventricosum]|nr:hypothetical protein BHM03_00051349 [Ensete ventricosum]